MLVPSIEMPFVSPSQEVILVAGAQPIPETFATLILNTLHIAPTYQIYIQCHETLQSFCAFCVWCVLPVLRNLRNLATLPLCIVLCTCAGMCV